MKKLSLLFCFAITFCQTKAQNNKEQQQVKSIILQAYESVSQSTRQWFADVSPAGDIDTVYIKSKLNEKFSIGLAAGGASGAEIFACMMAYQQLLNKEAKAERRMEAHMKRLLLASKEEKLQMEKESIDQGMKEARERAERAMDAAATSLVIAIASGLIQIVSAASSNAGKKIESLPVYLKKLELQLVILKKKEK